MADEAEAAAEGGLEALGGLVVVEQLALGGLLQQGQDAGSLSKTMNQLYPDVDWEAQARQLVEKSGMKPPVSRALTSAPAASSIRQMSVWRPAAALCSG